MRLGFATLALLLAAGCYHDNASPFVHGAHNRPGFGGSTMVPRPHENVDQRMPNGYSGSSGFAGGVEKNDNVGAQPEVAGGGVTPPGANTPTSSAGTPTAAPSGSGTQPATAAGAHAAQ